MKILLVNNFHYMRGGSERAYFDTGKILENHGHQVAYFSTLNTKNNQSIWENYFIKDNDLREEQSAVKKMLIAAGIIFNLKARKNMARILDDFKPDIVHMHNIYHHLSPSIIYEIKKRKIPMVMTLHDYKLISPNYNLFVNGKIWEKSLYGNYRECFKDKCIHNSYVKSLICSIESFLHKKTGVYLKINKFISPSIFLKDKFLAAGFPKDIVYLPNPLPEAGDLRYQAENKEPGNYILFFGRISEEKGARDLIEAYKGLYTGMELHLAGEGPEMASLKKLVSEYGLEDKIKFLGHKQKNELWDIVSKASFIVIPSKWLENAPYSVLEAMVLTKIVLCANIGGFTELIKNGINGFLFEHNNITDLRKRMQHICDNIDKISNIGENARKEVLSRNDRETYYNNLINIYKCL